MDLYDEDTLAFVRDAEEKLKDLHFRDRDTEGHVRTRDGYARDYGRILYSASFRRLQGKMQLLGIDNTHFFRNRLTHSLEVAQIARGLAIDLGLSTTFVVEACSLAHDLGNPPIGHHGETVLNRLVQDIGGFEGNAQTLRILRRLEKKHHAYRGLNLCFRTQLGVIKYFQRNEGGRRKKFIYEDDYQAILRTLEAVGLDQDNAATIDMQIMDMADEIAYAAHDLEDCLSQNLFSIDDLLYEFRIRDKYKEALPVLERIVEECKQFANCGNTFHSSEEYSFLFRKELTSKIVNTLIRDVAYLPATRRLGFKSHGKLSEGLKQLVFHLIMRRPSVQIYESKGEKVLVGLYEVYTDRKLNNNLQLLPPEYRIFTYQEERRRNVIDFISGMMDQFAIQEYIKYYGKGAYDKLV